MSAFVVASLYLQPKNLYSSYWDYYRDEDKWHKKNKAKLPGLSEESDLEIRGYSDNQII